MATISITTAQNIDVEYELASLGDRVLGRLVDGLVIAGYIALLLAFFSLSNLWNAMGDGWWIIILLLLPIMFYDLLSEVLMNGQSVGKKVMKMKVISLSGDQASTSQYLIRWLFRVVDFSISGSLVGLITVAATEKHQRLGDIVAGTTLVKTKPRTSIHQTLYTPVAQMNYTVTYPEVTQLSDRDMQLVKEVLMNVQKSGNTMLALQTMQKIEQKLNIMSKHEPVTFLYAVMSDYNHLASKL